MKKILIVLFCMLLFVGCTNSKYDEVRLKTTRNDNIRKQYSGFKRGIREEQYKRGNIVKEEYGRDKVDNKIIKIRPINKVKVGKEFILEGLEKRDDIKVNDPGSKLQWALIRTNIHNVWDKIEQKRVVKVAVIDTGIDYNHIDLKNRINEKEGYDFVNDDDDALDDNGHGTHVAGIIGAECNNNEGIVGVVGNLEIDIIPIKVLNENGEGKIEDIIKGIKYAIEKDVDIINLSLGGLGDNEELSKCIEYAIDNDILVVAAAGNDKRNTDKYLPAKLDGVFTVASYNILGKKAGFSNFGETVDISAPGVKILSTVLNNEYEAWDGTSMSSPIVTGIAALLMSNNEKLTANETKDILIDSVKDVYREGKDMLSGYGYINAKMAFDSIKNDK